MLWRRSITESLLLDALTCSDAFRPPQKVPSLSQYLSEIKSLCDQLDSIGALISEQEKFFGVINGLGREYEAIVTVIEDLIDTLPGPSLDDVMFKLTGFEDKLQKYETAPEATQHQAFYTNRGGYFGRSRG